MTRRSTWGGDREGAGRHASTPSGQPKTRRIQVMADEQQYRELLRGAGDRPLGPWLLDLGLLAASALPGALHAAVVEQDVGSVTPAASAAAVEQDVCSVTPAASAATVEQDVCSVTPAASAATVEQDVCSVTPAASAATVEQDVCSVTPAASAATAPAPAAAPPVAATLLVLAAEDDRDATAVRESTAGITEAEER